MIDGTQAPLWFGPAKFATTLATAAAGLPGGIFAPSLATGAGLGAAVHLLFPAQPTGAVVLLGMVAYFTGVVRAPLTSVIILSETTGSRGLLLPLLRDGADRRIRGVAHIEGAALSRLVITVPVCRCARGRLSEGNGHYARSRHHPHRLRRCACRDDRRQAG